MTLACHWLAIYYVKKQLKGLVYSELENRKKEIKQLHDYSTKIRDSSSKIYNACLKIYKISSKSVYLRFLKNAFYNILIDWDDLVEDISIVSDAEIKELLDKIAE